MAMETSLQQTSILQQMGAWMKIYGNSFMGPANQRRESGNRRMRLPDLDFSRALRACIAAQVESASTATPAQE